jgi:hypothetical protein
MQLTLRGHWTVTVTDGWVFYLLENAAVKLFLLQEDKYWVHELFVERGTECVHRQLFPYLLNQPQDLSIISG